MKQIALATLFFFTTALATPALVSAQPSAGRLTVPVTGAGGGAVFAGTFELQKFVNSQGQVVASGILSGIVTTATGATKSIVKKITLPVVIGETTCDILHLDLGPLNLDLLGLQINLSQIVLDITAESGAGNLLGNLLCAVANLLNNPSGLAKLLNSILAAL